MRRVDEEGATVGKTVQFRLWDAFQNEAVHPRLLPCRTFQQILSTETQRRRLFLKPIPTEAFFIYFFKLSLLEIAYLTNCSDSTLTS